MRRSRTDRKSTRLNSSHANIYTLSLHDALPIYKATMEVHHDKHHQAYVDKANAALAGTPLADAAIEDRSEEHTSELQSRQYLHSFPTRRSSDLQGDHGSPPRQAPPGVRGQGQRRPGGHAARGCGDRG